MYLSNARRQERRPGKVLAMFAMALPALLGMLAIIIDGGMGLGFHRQLQNATDAAAKAAALRLFQDWHMKQMPIPWPETRKDNARQVARDFIRTHYGYTGANPSIEVAEEITDPRYADRVDKEYYVRVSMTHTVNTWLAHILGAANTPIRAESIAGFEHPFDPRNPNRWPEFREGVIALDPWTTDPPPPPAPSGHPRTGIVLETRSRLTVDGSVVMNARGIGFDQYLAGVTPEDPASTFPSLRIPDNVTTLRARYVQARGGVERRERVRDYLDPTQLGTLFCHAGMVPDPFSTNRPPEFQPLVVPPLSVNRGTVEITSANSPYTLMPGVYDDIHIHDRGIAVFVPGIYVLRPKDYQPEPRGLRIAESSTVSVQRDGPVMFYFTSIYDPEQLELWDRYDRMDGAVDYDYVREKIPAPSAPSQKIAILDINLNSTSIRLQGSNDSRWPGVLFFQKRHSVQIPHPALPYDESNRFRIYGSLTRNSYLRGVAYAKWGTMRFGGTESDGTLIPAQGTFDMQFVVGNMLVQSGSDVTLDNIPARRHTARKTFLVQ